MIYLRHVRRRPQAALGRRQALSVEGPGGVGPRQALAQRRGQLPQQAVLVQELHLVGGLIGWVELGWGWGC